MIEIIGIWLISSSYDEPPAGPFKIMNTCELVARNCHWATLQHDVQIYVKIYNVCLAFKVICHKRYNNLQLVPVPIHCWKDLSMNFVIDLSISTNWKVIVLTKSCYS